MDLIVLLVGLIFQFKISKLFYVRHYYVYVLFFACILTIQTIRKPFGYIFQNLIFFLVSNIYLQT